MIKEQEKLVPVLRKVIFCDQCGQIVSDDQEIFPPHVYAIDFRKINDSTERFDFCGACYDFIKLGFENRRKVAHQEEGHSKKDKVQVGIDLGNGSSTHGFSTQCNVCRKFDCACWAKCFCVPCENECGNTKVMRYSLQGEYDSLPFMIDLCDPCLKDCYKNHKIQELIY